MVNYSTDPKGFKLVDENRFDIVWKDNHNSTYDSFRLRVLCPCAECRGGHGGKIGANTTHINPPITFKDYDTVGRYAVNFLFSDSHNTGIYAFDYLRGICPCEVCKEDAENNYK